jgi:hypothetical protein
MRMLDELQLIGNVEAGAAEKGGDGLLVEAGGVVFHAYRAFLFLKKNASDSINFAQAVKGAHLGFARLLSIMENYIDGCHFGSCLSMDVAKSLKPIRPDCILASINIRHRRRCETAAAGSKERHGSPT